MRLSKAALRRIIREEVEQLSYEVSKPINNIDLDDDFPEELDPVEDGWTNGTIVQPEEYVEPSRGIERMAEARRSSIMNKNRIRRALRKAINESGYSANSSYSSRGHGYSSGGYRDYDRQRRSREYEMEEEYSQDDGRREQLGRLHASLRKMYQQNPDLDARIVVRSMMDQWDRSFEDEIIDYWTMLQS